jgi:hypothetical protein
MDTTDFDDKDVEEDAKIRRIILEHAERIATVALTTPASQPVNIIALSIHFYEAIKPAIAQYREAKRERYLERLNESLEILA